MITNEQIQYPEFRIGLRKAALSDRPVIYTWLAESNLTSSMLGEPNYPDAPVPSWNEFVDDFTDGFFTDEIMSSGRCFILCTDAGEIGTVCYDLLNLQKKWVVLDIWLKDEKYCGYGYGPEALKLLCLHLLKLKGITTFYIAPSQRNVRAVKAYQKAGFHALKMNRYKAKKKFGVDIFDYNDNVVLKKVL